MVTSRERLRLDIAPALFSLLVAIPALIVNPDREQFEQVTPPSATAFVLVVIGCAALVVRRRYPIPVLVVVVVLRTVMGAGAGDEFALLVAATIALYTVARSGERRRALTIALIAGAVMAFAVAAADQDETFVNEVIGELAIALLPIAIADAVRSRSDRLRDLIDNEAAARVQAERLRIARDLHDVVAHGLSVIAVQSGVAAHLIEEDSRQAKESLAAINTASKQSLEELRAMVGVLRSTDDVPLMPTPTDPDDLSAIIDGAKRGGLGDATMDVNVTVDGSFPADASEASVVAVHRILAEALANVARHGGGADAQVTLTHRPTEVVLQVVNDNVPQSGSGPSAAASTGVGIIGMAERAESLGGSLQAGSSPDGGFNVTATIPYYHDARGRS